MKLWIFSVDQERMIHERRFPGFHLPFPVPRNDSCRNSSGWRQLHWLHVAPFSHRDPPHLFEERLYGPPGPRWLFHSFSLFPLRNAAVWRWDIWCIFSRWSSCGLLPLELQVDCIPWKAWWDHVCQDLVLNSIGSNVSREFQTELDPKASCIFTMQPGTHTHTFTHEVDPSTSKGKLAALLPHHQDHIGNICKQILECFRYATVTARVYQRQKKQKHTHRCWRPRQAARDILQSNVVLPMYCHLSNLNG